jgi:hypothetical protein
MMYRAFVRTLALWLALWPLAATATQLELVPPTTGIYTGPQFSQKIGDAFRSLASCQKGSIAPANVGGATVDGLCWIDDSASPWVLKRYVNGGWAVEGAFDPSTSSYAGLIGGGLGSVASAATTDLNLVPQANVTITGTTTIGSFGSASPAGVVKFIRFAGVLTLTNSAAVTVPGGFDLTTAANDRAIVTHLGSGNWEITQYTRASGIPIDIAAVGKPDFTFSVSVPPLHVAGYGQALTRTSYPAYLAKVTRAQNGTRTSGNATIASIANTDGFGVGMPVESTGVNAGCTIASVVANTSITLNSSACVTASGTSTVTVFPYGYGTGGGATTVGVPDCRNRALAGRDRNDPGSLANLLTTTYFGANSGIFGATGGGESQSLTLAQLPTGITSGNATQPISVIFGGNIPLTLGTISSVPTVSTGSLIAPTTSASWTGITSVSTNNSISVTSSNTGGGAHPNVQPTLIAECVVRVIP